MEGSVYSTLFLHADFCFDALHSAAVKYLKQDIQQNRKGRSGSETHTVNYFLCLSINLRLSFLKIILLNGQVYWRKLKNIGQAKEKSKSSIIVLCRFILDKYFLKIHLFISILIVSIFHQNRAICYMLVVFRLAFSTNSALLSKKQDHL